MVFCLTAAGIGEEPQDPSRLTLERIFGTGEFRTDDRGPAQWFQAGSGYTTLEASAKLPGAKDVVQYDPVSGRREVVVPAARLVPLREPRPLAIESYAWSEDGQKLLVFTNSKRVWRMNTRGDYWLYDRHSHQLHQLGGNAEPSTLMFAALSPNGRQVAYVCHHNLYVQDLHDLHVTQLTSDGSEHVINGTGDWVYEEEFSLRKAFRWSPDSRHIAYWQFDTSGVPEFYLVNDTDGLYPKVTPFAYPKVGQTNSACRVGVVPASGGPTTWFQTTADPRNHYIPEMEWAPDSKSVVFQQLNRLQNTNQVTRGDVKTGAVRVLLTDRDDCWVDVAQDWHWLGQGKRFLWLSERDGWRHLYAVSRSGQELKLLTPGDYDVVGIAGVDERRGAVYYLASPDNPTQRYLYRAALDGSGKARRITPADQPGTHSYQISQDGQWALHTVSRFGKPPVVSLIRLPEHRTVRTLIDNAKLSEKLAALQACPHEFFRVDIGQGVSLDAWCIQPPKLDPHQRYPLLLQVYGEPAGQTVVDAWGGDGYLWHRMLAQQGYLVMSIDNRGTAAPRGREWRKCIYRQIGSLASGDQAAATRTILAQRSYVDPERIGIWGWSGGGSMSLNAIFRYPDLYRTALAIAFISDQRFYDTIYQERYMGLPADNEAGYKHGSPITYAHQLQGNLLLVYGTGDDNCHYQNCEVLINKLIEHNKQFSLMAYPNRTHSIREGPNTRRHLYETLTRYLHEHLPAGPAE